jgi:hypothetical protein
MTATTTTSPDAVLVSPAAALAEAEIAAETAATARHEAEAARGVVLTRIQEKDTRRAEIAARRAAGDERDADGAELALLSVDREVLVELLSRRDAAAAAARAEAEKHVRALAQARADLAREEGVRTAAALDRHLGELEALLLETLRQSNAVAKRIGRAQTLWVPTVELESSLVPLCAMRSRW